MKSLCFLAIRMTTLFCYNGLDAVFHSQGQEEKNACAVLRQWGNATAAQVADD